jgi:hypothetical protein
MTLHHAADADYRLLADCCEDLDPMFSGSP